MKTILLLFFTSVAFPQCGLFVINPVTGNLDCTGPAAVGTGTVTSIGTTAPITGGTITTTGTIACATCTTSAASLTSGRVLYGSGLQAISTDANFNWDSTRGFLGIGRSTKLASLTTQAKTSFVISTCTTTANATADIIGVGAGCLFTANIGIGSRIALSSDLTAIGTVTAIISDTELILDSAYWGDSLGDGTSQTITAYPGTAAMWTSGGVPFWSVSSDGHIGGAMNGLPVFDNGSGSGAFTLPDSFVFLQGILTPAIAAIAGAESTLNVDASTALGDVTDYSSKGVVAINVAAFHQGTGTTLDAATAIQSTAGAGVAGNTVTRATILSASSFNPGTVGTFTVFKWNVAGGGGTIHNLKIVDCEDEPQVDTFQACMNSNITAGTGKWAFYGAGTAASKLFGDLTIDTIKSTTGQVFVCADTAGKLVRSATACVGTI